MTPGYFDAPEETASILRDGWLWTGDVAHRDEDGFFYVVGRAKEILKIGGHRVSPAQIETVLSEHADVEDVAVAGIEDALTGEASAALVVLRSGAVVTVSELQRFCRERLAHPLVPRIVRLVAALPRNASGSPPLLFAVHFADGDERTLRLVASCNMPEAPAELFVFEKDGDEPAKCSARSRLLFLASDDDERDGTLFAVPLLSGTRLLGAVTCELPARLESRELASLDAMGVVFGALVDRARRAEECRARAEWTSLVAHELRQPLNALSMHATVLDAQASRSDLTSSVRRSATA